MDVSLKVTDQPQEASFYDIVSGDNVISIPLFQRPYRWAKRHLDWLLADVDQIRDDATKSVFLGIIVCVSRGATPGRPLLWEIVDGQQRLSTLYLFILAAAETAARNGHPDWASRVLGTYLLVRPLADNPVNTKLIPSYADRAQFKKIWDQLVAIPEVAGDTTIQTNPPMPPPPSGLDHGLMLKQYNRIRRALALRWNDGELVALERMVEIAAQRMSVVSISLRDPIVAPKIFERLNDRAERVTASDLVRNEVFARSPVDAAQAQHIFSNHWEPFAAHFANIQDGLEKFLFPYGLILNSNVTKVDLFTEIRRYWATLVDPQAIIADLERFRTAFLALETGVAGLQIPPALRRPLVRLHRLGKPSSTYAFVMRLVYAVQMGQVPEPEAVQILGVLDSFLFRRAICGIEPTGLHAVFKGMWTRLAPVDGQMNVTAATVTGEISNRSTVPWPSNAEFANNIRTGNLYDRNVKTYALQEYEDSRPGETPADNFFVEHILPQTPTDEWRAIFGVHFEELVNTWANLIPLTSAMNPAVGHSQYSVKRAAYAESIFATARELATTYSAWTPTEVRTRAEAIATWALQRWPHVRQPAEATGASELWSSPGFVDR